MLVLYPAALLNLFISCEHVCCVHVCVLLDFFLLKKIVLLLPFLIWGFFFLTHYPVWNSSKMLNRSDESKLRCPCLVSDLAEKAFCLLLAIMLAVAICGCPLSGWVVVPLWLYFLRIFYHKRVLSNVSSASLSFCLLIWCITLNDFGC